MDLARIGIFRGPDGMLGAAISTGRRRTGTGHSILRETAGPTYGPHEDSPPRDGGSQQKWSRRIGASCLSLGATGMVVRPS